MNAWDAAPFREARIDLQAAKNGDVEVPAADQSERHRAVKDACTGQGADRPPSGIGEQWMGHALVPALAPCRSIRFPTGRIP